MHQERYRAPVTRSAAQTPGGVSVELRGVSKRYGGGATAFIGVDNISLAIAPGDFCVLVGPSGCGKTTTLKMVNRLIEPTSGQIFIDGQDISTLDAVELRRRIGYVIQQVGLFPHQTIAENVATVPRLLGWDSERIRRRVEELLSLVGLDPGVVRRRYPTQLSGGERQRVGVARALAAEPPLMLMDEPFGAVDPIVRGRLQDEFLRLHAQLGMTVMFVTHDIDEAIKLGTTVAVFSEGGCLAQHAPPSRLLASPASDYVARFVGSDRVIKRLALISLADVALELGAGPQGAPTLARTSNLRDALSTLLSTRADAVTVVGEDGVAIGAISMERIRMALDDVARSWPENEASSEGPAGRTH
ncbi:MAG: transporter related [Chloroflexi bacterium]|nr:transporter related [Chloroflexota bacterium]